MMHSKSFGDDPMERLLQSLDAPIADDGFTDQVTYHLKWGRHRRSAVLAMAAVIGATITLWLLPDGYIGETFAQAARLTELFATLDMNIIYIFTAIIGAGAWLLKGDA